MKTLQTFLATTVLFSITLACGDAKDKKDLKKKNDRLNSENASLQQNLVAANAELAQANQNLAPALAAAASDQETVASLRASVQKAQDELSLLIKNSMAPYNGIWLLDPAPAANCQVMVRFDAESSVVYRTVVCGDKVQAEIQTVKSFLAKNGAGWTGTLGVTMASESLKDSCGDLISFVASGSNYSFDHSMGTATSSTEAALFMTSEVGTTNKNFKSGSVVADLGKNKSCDQIMKRSALASQKDNLLLQQAALVCKLTPALTNAVCHTAANHFEVAQ